MEAITLSTDKFLYLLAQTATIIIFLVWIWLLALKLKGQRYGYYYIFVRLIFYRDAVPLNWLRGHKLFIFYAIQILALLFINTGLIMQIRDETLYSKPWVLIFGNQLLAISAMSILEYFVSYVRFLEDRNLDEHLLELQRKIRRLKRTKGNS